MPYQMTHLVIADKIIRQKLFDISNKSQCYLGSIAPDSYYFHETKIDKRISHHNSGNVEWAYIADDIQWINDIVNLYRDNFRKYDYNFLFGYCSHILTDILSHRIYWTPFRLKHTDFSKEIFVIRDLAHKAVDKQLYFNYEFSEEIFDSLRNSECFDFDGKAYKNDLERMKTHILDRQFTKENFIEKENREIITYEEQMELIDDSIKFITKEFIHKI